MKSLINTKPVIITNRPSFDKEFNKWPEPMPRFGRETLALLQEKIEECGALNDFFINHSNRISLFEFIHENEDGFFYEHVVTYKY